MRRTDPSCGARPVVLCRGSSGGDETRGCVLMLAAHPGWRVIRAAQTITFRAAACPGPGGGAGFREKPPSAVQGRRHIHRTRSVSLRDCVDLPRLLTSSSVVNRPVSLRVPRLRSQHREAPPCCGIRGKSPRWPLHTECYQPRTRQFTVGDEPE